MLELSDSPSLPLPVTLEQVDAGWLTRALRQRLPGVTITSATIEDVLYGTSTKIRVRVEACGEGAGSIDETLIVKGGFERHSPLMAAMYANEVRFYADIQSEIPMPSPRCYFAGVDPASHQGIVILEDLRRPGIEFCDALRPHSYDRIARRMETMAAYHAATWQSKHFAPGGRWADIQSRFDGWGLEYMRRYLEPATWESSMALPRGAAVALRLKNRSWMERALAAIGEIQRRQPRCLVHGDTHLGNLYVGADGTPGYFDAQVAQTAWHHEVSYHITCAADLADRRAWEQGLLRVYLDSLEAGGGPTLAWEDAWLDYRRSLVWGLFIFLINQTQFQTEAVNTAYAARFGQAALDHDLPELLP